MDTLRDKTIVIVCSDPGAAQVVLLLHSILSAQHAQIRVIARHSGKKIAQNMNISVESRHQAYGSYSDIIRYLREERVDAIVTGTSLKDDIERMYIRAGTSLGILTLSFIDWWTSIRARFSYTRRKKIILPDWVGVVDDHAAALVRSTLGRTVNVVVMGHPYLTAIARQKHLSTTQKREIIKELQLIVGASTIVFFPEPLYPKTGFNQFIIFQKIIQEIYQMLKKNPALKVNLILKFHPNGQQPRLLSRYRRLVAFSSNPRIVVRYVCNEYSVGALIDLADFVWGMNTTPLLEGMLRGKLVSSFLPDVSIPGIPFTREAGFCQSVDTYDKIIPLVKRLMTDQKFVRMALLKQKKYILPKKDFAQTMIHLLTSYVSSSHPRW